MPHWITEHGSIVDRLQSLVRGTDWSIEYEENGDHGPVELNHEDGAQISIMHITFMDGNNYYKIEHVKDTDPFGDPTDPQLEESGDLEDVVEFAEMIVQQ